MSHCPAELFSPLAGFAKLRAFMRDEALDAVVVGPSASFRQLLGRNANLTERMVALLLTADDAVIVVPRLQQPLYQHLPIERAIWDEHEDPTVLACRILRERGCRTIGINREFWSGFLMRMQEHAPDMIFKGAVALDLMRAIKTPDEIAALTRAAHRIDEVWDRFLDQHPILSGRTELELRSAIMSLMQGAGFSHVAWVDVGAGPNGASSLHHGSDYVIRPGDAIVFDFAGVFDGWYADICRVAAAGTPEQEYLDAYSILIEAQEAAFQAIRPGVPASAPDEAARAILTAAGYGDAFTHRVGHGIGLDAHEEPYLVRGSNLQLAVGMVMSDEPGIYLPGRWGMRVEDIVALTADGPVRLNRASRSLAIRK
ncbi:M24 family metallopeptidase [Rhizobium puerariae]|uniref:M24 family metallopeptidase n=1 Tax=Rhizobium puerariae TaxID=1585791 RepID=A0ABV6AF12_9HYPH